MDPFRKRLRKQFERSSLHARKLNKNATTLLHKQLLTLERRKQENARAIMRHRQALLEELTGTEEPEYVGMEEREDVAHRPGPSQVFPKTVEHPWLPPSSSTTPSSRLASLAVSHVDPKCAHSLTSSRGFLTSDLPLAYSRHCGSQLIRDRTHPEVCRFEALPPLNPCPYFPCRRPLHYHRLKVSDVPDIAPLRTEPEMPQTKTSSMAVLCSVGTPSAVACTSTSSFSSPPDKASAAACARDGGQADGPVSPRISINDRLRGLRQLVRELREKNEEKKPRDWTVNYGEPVSRRLLRKPLVPVSDE